MSKNRKVRWRTQQPIAAIGFALIVCFLSGCRDNISDKNIELVPLAEVRALSSGDPSVVLIDPRSAQEFAKGRLPGARNVRLPDIADEPNAIPPELSGFSTFVVYGNDPGSAVARAMTKRLLRAGAKNAVLFSGGLSEWMAAGYPTEPGKAPAPK